MMKKDRTARKHHTDAQAGPTAPSAAAPIGDGLQNVVTGLGTSADRTTHNKFYRKRFAPEQLGELYLHWAFAKAADAPVEDMLREWRVVKAPSISNPDLIDGFYREEIKINLKRKLEDALKWARVYGSSIIVMNVADAAADASEPIDLESIHRGGLISLDVYDSSEVEAIHDLDLSPDPRNPRPMQSKTPVAYRLNDTTQRIHPSRVVRFDCVRLPWQLQKENNFWGGSLFERIYDAVLEAASTSAAISTLVSEANVDVVSVSGLFDSLMSGRGESGILDRFRLGAFLKSTNRLMILDKDREQYERHPVQFSALPQILEQQFSLVAAAADIPISRFLGEAAKGLNATGEGDLRNYYDMVSAKQESELAPALRNLDAVLTRHVFGFQPADWYFEFEPLWTISDLDASTIEKAQAETDGILLEAGIVQPHHIAERLQASGRYPGMTAEDVAALKAIGGELDLSGFDFGTGELPGDGV